MTYVAAGLKTSPTLKTLLKYSAYGKKWEEGDVIEVVCDFDQKKVRFIHNQEDQGTAMKKIHFDQEDYYFALSVACHSYEIEIID